MRLRKLSLNLMTIDIAMWLDYDHSAARGPAFALITNFSKLFWTLHWNTNLTIGARIILLPYPIWAFVVVPVAARVSVVSTSCSHV